MTSDVKIIHYFRLIDTDECVSKYGDGISGKLESLLTISSHIVSVLTDYDLKSQIIELNKSTSASQPVLTNRYQ